MLKRGNQWLKVSLFLWLENNVGELRCQKANTRATYCTISIGIGITFYQSWQNKSSSQLVLPSTEYFAGPKNCLISTVFLVQIRLGLTLNTENVS